MNDASKLKAVRAALALVAGLGLVAFLLWAAKPHPERDASRPGMATNAGSGPIAKAATAGNHAASDALAKAANDLRARPGAARDALANLRQALAKLGPGEAAKAIRTFLDSRQDASTGLGFVVGGDGTLAGAPTLRVYLLDLLGQLDPAGAVAYAKVVLGSLESPDEWAVALRNLARGDPSAEGRTLLEQKVGELLRHKPWQPNPSAGYLEAFDVAVFVGGTKLIAPLSDLVRQQDNRAVGHAAFLALDRLVIGDPATTLAALLAAPELMQGREPTRADYFARSDVRSPQQRQVLESYLLDPRIGPAELDQFAGVYPNANYMLSQNLLTRPPAAEGAALAARDAESLRVLQQWLADARFARLKPQLERAQRRLAKFVRQENRGR